MKIFKVLAISRVGDSTKEYRYYFSCYRKARSFVVAQRFAENGEHGSIFSMVPGLDGRFVADKCLDVF